jgi:hypothetical protein
MNKKIIFLFNPFLMQCGMRMNKAGTKPSTMNCILRINVETAVESTMLDTKSSKAHEAIRKRINARHNLLVVFLSERRKCIPTPAENVAAPR